MRQRVVTALLLAIPALLALALRSTWPLAALGLAAAGIGGSEADRLVRGWGPLCTLGVVWIFLGVACVPLFGPVSSAAPAACAVGLLLGAFAAAGSPEGLAGSFAKVVASLWIALPLVAILLLHRTALGTGLWCLSPALMALVPVWAGDVAAIFAGRAFGKRPLAPKISPKKTVEGSIANLLAAVLAAWLLGRLLGLPDLRSVGAGLAVGVLGQAGDLFESWLKRRADVKDSGSLLPGHGGVLDRIDSVLFAAPAVALILLS